MKKNNYNGRNDNGYQPLPPEPPKFEHSYNTEVKTSNWLLLSACTYAFLFGLFIGVIVLWN